MFGPSIRMTLTAILVVVITGTASAQSISWQSDFDSALERARATGKLVLVNIHASWCVPCKKLQAGTLSDPGLGAEIMTHCEPVSLDADVHSHVIRQWPITGFPTQLFIAPDGKVVNTIVGNVPVGTYRAALQKAVQAVASAPRPQVAPVVVNHPPAVIEPSRPADQHPPLMPAGDSVASREPSPPPSQPPAMNAFPPATTSSTESGPLDSFVAEPNPPAVAPRREVVRDSKFQPCDESQPLALGGFCPVTMLVRAELIRGTHEECCVYNHHRYQFRSSEDRQAFLANPERYLPSEEGFCVVTWAEKHAREPGLVQFPALYGDFLFLFADDPARQKFLQDPERYVDNTGRAHRIPLHTFRGDQPNVR